MQPVLVTTTTNARDEASNLANILVSRKLAACVNIVGPIQSVYSWQGKIVNDEEYKLFIKSFENHWESLKKCIKENHSYKVPEISMIIIAGMHTDYLNWMNNP